MSAQQQQPKQNQPLPSKESGLFKQCVKFYEEKQYKKAIKTADQILKKFPDHGETLAMKGLTISNMGADKKEEAYELVRRGLKADLKSHVCWHVYGLLYRADRDYREAIKCYLNALRQDPDNIQILRDLALLQVQMRDLQGFVDTRQRLLALKPSNRNHWITFAVAQHANKQYDVAVQVLDAYEASLSEIPSNEAYEHSELLLYKATIMDQGGRLDDALTLLDAHKDKIKDKQGMLEHRASLLQRLGRAAEAEQQYRALLATNPDHYRWHEGLQLALGLKAAADTPLTDAQRAGLRALYTELSGTYPRSSACKRIPLDFLQGADFVQAADAYVRPYLRKGVPSLFRDIRPLYSDKSKAEAIQKLLESYSTSLGASSTFPPLSPASSPACNGSTSEAAASSKEQQESPQTWVWTLYCLAQHYDYLGDPVRGLSLIDEALSHTPTLIELYSARSKLLRHAGDLEGAVHAAETARRTDLSDRYLNSMAVKALMRADRVDAAEKTAALFTRDGDQGSAGVSALHDMQHMWYECAAGEAHMRKKEYGKALKQYTTVLKHFEDIHEDQFDFHGYCVRKTTLRAYVDMLRMEDGLFAHPFYLKAAAGAVKAYLALADDAPNAAQQAADEEALLASMTAEERKKYKLKKKKEEKTRAKEAEEAAAATAAQKDSKKKAGAGADKKEKDSDPDGAKLAACEDPVGEAAKVVGPLKQHAPSALTTQLLAAEVYGRRGRMLLALSAVQRAVKAAAAAAAAAAEGPAASPAAAAAHPDVHLALVTFCCRAQAALQPAAASGGGAAAAPLHPVVAQLLTAGVKELLGGAADCAAYNSQWVAAHSSTSLAHRMAGARAMEVVQGAAGRPAAVKLVTGAPLEGSPAQLPSHAECVEAGRLLDTWDSEAAAQWRTRCAAAFPYSRYFGGPRVITLDPSYNFDNMTEAFGKLSF